MAETDFRDVAGLLASSFNQMRLRPDPGLDARLQTIRQQKTANRAKNKTVEYLRGLNTPMGNQLAGMVETGGITGQQAYAQILQLQSEERDFQREKELADYKAKDTALIRNALAAGFKPGTPEFQTFIASGGDIYSQETALLSSLPKPDKGMMYQFDKDENGRPINVRMVPIGGSEAAIEEEERQRKLAENVKLKDRAAFIVTDSVNQVLDVIKQSEGAFIDLPETGAIGKFLADYTFNTEARDVKVLLSALQANTAFKRLQEMREASKTGGALGNVSNVELGLLMNAYGAISQDLSKDRLIANLNKINEIMGMVADDPIANHYFETGEDLRGTDLDKQVKAGKGQGGGGSGASSSTATHRFNPETGKVEAIR